MTASANMVAYKVVFFALGCFMLATLIYTTVTDGSPFRIELLTPLATCAYITLKLFNITSQHLQDPVSQLLLRKDHEHNVKCSSIMIGRVLFSTLGIVVLVVVVYTVITDGLPFRTELLTPWMAATLIDFYINVFAISVWVVHKESTWISAFFWICLLICFGSITTCAYIVIQLLRLSLEDPMYHVLLDSRSKHGSTSAKKD
uniref:Transmembrane protein n=1 Tax=Musa acuminata subsp. malaccensis TaxID=214687 RepID=A0A804JTQ0_MUSAM